MYPGYSDANSLFGDNLGPLQEAVQVAEVITRYYSICLCCPGQQLARGRCPCMLHVPVNSVCTTHSSVVGFEKRHQIYGYFKCPDSI